MPLTLNLPWFLAIMSTVTIVIVVVGLLVFFWDLFWIMIDDEQITLDSKFNKCLRAVVTIMGTMFSVTLLIMVCSVLAGIGIDGVQYLLNLFYTAFSLWLS